MDDEKLTLLQTIARVKRGTGHADVLTVCEALEKFLLVRTHPITDPEQVRLRFDKNAYQKQYMRGYMRKRRAEARKPKG